MSTIVVGPDTPPDLNGKALKAFRDEAIRQQGNMRVVRQWDRMKRMYMCDFYSDIEMPEWKAKKGNPALWEIVQRFMPVITARKPRFTPTGRGPEDELMAKMLAVGVDYEWECQRMKRKSALFAKTGMTFGVGFFYTGVNAGLRSDDLYTKVLTPYDVFPDPGATSLEDATYVWIKFTVTKRQLAALLGPYAKKLLPKIKAGEDSSQDSKFREGPKSNNDMPLIGTLQANQRTATSQPFDTEIVGPQSPRYTNEGHYTVWECWLPEADDSEVVKVLDGEEIVLPIKGHGRRALLIEDQYFDELDTENPFRHGQVPLSMMGVDDFPSEFWASSYLLPGADRAEQIADLDNQFLNHIRLTMNSGWKIPAQSGIPPGTVYSYPGMQLVYTHPYAPEQFNAPEIPASAFTHRMNLKRELDDAYGLSSIGRGNVDGGITHASGTTVQALQAPMSERMACIIDNFEDAISRWGYQTLCNLVQFWPEEKWRRVLPQDLQTTTTVDPMTGMEVPQMVPLPWDDPVIQGEDYDAFLPDIKMETGSSLPEDKQGKLANAYNLNDRGAFGAPGGALASREMLQAAEWPGREEIVQHVAQEQEAAMAAQQAPAQPDFGGGQNKAFGGQRSPASEASVRQTGQEVRG